MAASYRARRTETEDYWPGFVDALSALLLVIIFLLSVFVLAYVFLGQALTGRDEALAELNDQLVELGEMLDLERAASQGLREELEILNVTLQTEIETREAAEAREEEMVRAEAALQGDLAEALEAQNAAAARLAELETARENIIARLAATEAEADAERREREALERANLEAQLLRAELEKARAEQDAALSEEQRISDQARRQVELLNQQIAALRTQLREVEGILAEYETREKELKAAGVDLGKRLNRALAQLASEEALRAQAEADKAAAERALREKLEEEVGELARYRSEFFGRVRGIIGDRPGVQIVGDRFVFGSEVLFDAGAATLDPRGEAELRIFAEQLLGIAAEMPRDIDWVLRVDGHTDNRPINTPEFPSNWELSTARATSVVKYLVSRGLPPSRLAATGFGEFRPLDASESETAYARNRRIELKFTER